MFRFIAIALFSTAIAGCATTEGDYDGCHGIGCEVDDPNFDDNGDYVGCHGEGCLVDDPDE